MNRDDFDQQIREALQVVPSPQQVARLEHFWQQQQRRADRRRRLRRGLALAASILAVATLSTRLWWQEPAGQPRQANHAAPVAHIHVAPKTVGPIHPERPETALVAEPPSEDRSLSAGRPPTAYERFVFAIHTSQPAAAKPRVEVANIDEVIEQIKQDPTANIERLAEVVSQSTDRHVRAAIIRRLLTANDEPALRGYLSLLYDETIRAEALAVAETFRQQLPLASLLALLDDEEKNVRLAAAMVLGHVNGPEVTQSLISRVEREPSGPTEVWIALLTCRGPLAEEFLSYAAYQPLLLGHVNSARAQMAIMIP